MHQDKCNLSQHYRQVMLLSYSDRLQEHIGKIITPKIVAPYVTNLEIESLPDMVKFFKEFGLEFTGEYVNYENNHYIEQSNDTYPWETKSKEIEAVFLDKETKHKLVFSYKTTVFDTVNDSGKAVAIMKYPYDIFCERKGYGNNLCNPHYENRLNINAILEFANKMKIKNNLANFKIKKIRKKAPQESIEILKSHGYIIEQ